MTQQHITSAFDRDLEDIQAKIMKMGGLVEAAILEGAISLETRDEERAEKVRAADKAIDLLEEKINEDAARLIALRSPTASDLRLVLAIMKISGNLERIGDYAKNMAKRTGVLAQMAPVSDSAGSLRRMAKEVSKMLKDVLDAYIHRDAELAGDVIKRDSDVDQMYNGLFREFLTYMMEDPRNISRSMNVIWALRSLERIGDHASNISEQIFYLVKGLDVRHQTPDEMAQQVNKQRK